MSTYSIFVKTYCSQIIETNTTKEIIKWIKENLGYMNKAGIKIYVQPIKEEELQSPNLQRLLKNKYNVIGFPALYIPETDEFKSQTFNGIINIKKALLQIVQDGKVLTNRELTSVVAEPTDVEQFMQKTINKPDEPDTFGEDTLSPLEIHRKIAKFGETHKHLEKNKPIEVLNNPGKRPAAPIQREEIPQRPSNINPDDDMMDNFYKNRVNLDDTPNFY